MSELPDYDPRMLVRAIAAGSDDERWPLRVALLQLSSVEVDAVALASIGGCSIDKAEAVIEGLLASGLVTDD